MKIDLKSPDRVGGFFHPGARQRILEEISRGSGIPWGDHLGENRFWKMLAWQGYGRIREKFSRGNKKCFLRVGEFWGIIGPIDFIEKQIGDVGEKVKLEYGDRSRNEFGMTCGWWFYVWLREIRLRRMRQEPFEGKGSSELTWQILRIVFGA